MTHHVLHIDSSEESRERVARCLQKRFDLVQTRTGVGGANQVAERTPALVLVGTGTGELDPIETTLRLRSLTQLEGVPIVLMARPSERRAAYAAGADGVLPYPPNEKTLANMVERYINGHREDREETGEVELRAHSHRIVARLEAKVVELSDANAKLEEMARLRREFLRNVTHELATPMTPIVGYLKLLLEGDLGDLNSLQRKGLTSIRRSVVKLRDLIDTLLDVSAFERGRLHFYDRDYDFVSLSESAVGQARDGAPDDPNVQMELPPEPLPSRGDPDKLRRAMVHVMRNAMKFSPRGAPIHVRVQREGDFLEFAVTDLGSGIEEDEIERILEPFYQVDGSETRQHDGVGLGLAFALQVANALGGELTVESPPAPALNGTRVCLRVRAE